MNFPDWWTFPFEREVIVFDGLNIAEF